MFEHYPAVVLVDDSSEEEEGGGRGGGGGGGGGVERGVLNSLGYMVATRASSPEAGSARPAPGGARGSGCRLVWRPGVAHSNERCPQVCALWWWWWWWVWWVIALSSHFAKSGGKSVLKVDVSLQQYSVCSRQHCQKGAGHRCRLANAMAAHRLCCVLCVYGVCTNYSTTNPTKRHAVKTERALGRRPGSPPERTRRTGHQAPHRRRKPRLRPSDLSYTPRWPSCGRRLSVARQ